MTRKLMAVIALLIGELLLGSNARADVIGVGTSAFPASSTVIDFTGLPNGLEVNGLTVSGVGFDYTVNGAPVNGAVIIDAGVGTTNNISPPYIRGRFPLFTGTGILGITLPSPVNLFGYGFAVSARGGGVFPFPNLTSVSAFSGNTLLGSVSFTGNPDTGDPLSNVSGGFAGILSTTAFNRVALTFLFEPTAISPPAWIISDSHPSQSHPPSSRFSLLVL